MWMRGSFTSITGDIIRGDRIRKFVSYVIELEK